MRRNKPRLGTVEIDGSRSIDLHTGASIFSEPSACDSRAYLAISRYSSTRWRVCDNARPKSVKESDFCDDIIRRENIARCEYYEYTRRLVSIRLSQIVVSNKRCDRIYVCMCAGDYPAHVAGATNSYLKLYRTRLVPHITISRFTEPSCAPRITVTNTIILAWLACTYIAQ